MAMAMAMEYERIEKKSIISPTKLRMKLMGPHNNKKREGSNSNSSRTSPSRLQISDDIEVSKNSLLADSDIDNNEVAKLSVRENNQPKAQQFRNTKEDENLDYDSNASSSSFEFHKARSEQSKAYQSRQIPSKWNNADKWIMSRQNMVIGKNSQGSLIYHSTQTNDQPKVTLHSHGGGPVIRSVCMRDMGTEMTPIPSQEPSRSVTPVDATTPLSSLPSTPRGGGGGGQQEESSLAPEEEVRAKTRREIVALGVQLGKMNIAAWASKEEEEKKKNVEDAEETQRIEFEKRATAWEEAEKSKHNARYKREEIRIQAWESQEKAKLEAEMRRIEAKVEQMKAEAEAKMVKKIAMAKQRSEEKRASAEARKSRDAHKAVAEAQFIRETGRLPTSRYKLCCGFFS